ncbi:MAG: putative GIY-YIG superfamily endonuclease [Saprospiraceae bacterium]|jgi:predicted GIY-YIG superfamily endonuclease
MLGNSGCYKLGRLRPSSLSNSLNASFYAGATDDIEVRMCLHKSGKAGGYYQRNQCNKLVWFQEGATLQESQEKKQMLREATQLDLKSTIEKTNPGLQDSSVSWV